MAGTPEDMSSIPRGAPSDSSMDGDSEEDIFSLQTIQDDLDPPSLTPNEHEQEREDNQPPRRKYPKIGQTRGRALLKGAHLSAMRIPDRLRRRILQEVPGLTALGPPSSRPIVYDGLQRYSKDASTVEGCEPERRVPEFAREGDDDDDATSEDEGVTAAPLEINGLYNTPEEAPEEAEEEEAASVVVRRRRRRCVPVSPGRATDAMPSRSEWDLQAQPPLSPSVLFARAPGIALPQDALEDHQDYSNAVRSVVKKWLPQVPKEIQERLMPLLGMDLLSTRVPDHTSTVNYVDVQLMTLWETGPELLIRYLVQRFQVALDVVHYPSNETHARALQCLDDTLTVLILGDCYGDMRRSQPVVYQSATWEEPKASQLARTQRFRILAEFIIQMDQHQPGCAKPTWFKLMLVLNYMSGNPLLRRMCYYPPANESKVSTWHYLVSLCPGDNIFTACTEQDFHLMSWLLQGILATEPQVTCYTSGDMTGPSMTASMYAISQEAIEAYPRYNRYLEQYPTVRDRWGYEVDPEMLNADDVCYASSVLQESEAESDTDMDFCSPCASHVFNDTQENVLSGDGPYILSPCFWTGSLSYEALTESWRRTEPEPTGPIPEAVRCS